jgi:outer membrane protein OmpA-like peptidoglycan-associated protein
MIKKITILLIFLCVTTVKGQDEKYTIKNLTLNNSYSNFGTTFYGADQVVFSSPKKKSFIIRNIWSPNYQPFLDLYIGDIAEDGHIENVKLFSGDINSRYHEAIVAFTKDKKTVYFSRNNFLGKKFKKDSTGVNLIQLYRAKVKENGEWANIEPMPFNNDHYQTGHPTLSTDEKTLYFISDMPGSYGKTDIFKASISKDGSIGNPINLGPKINTSEKEMFPSICGDDELYFSTDGKEDSFGGLDVFVSKIYENGISEPKNLGAPINSEKDDFSFIINHATQRGYFSSNREGGKGDDDIYSFVQNTPIDFECYQYVSGIVTDKKSGALLPNSLVFVYDENNKELYKTQVGNDAKYNFKIKCNENYTLIGNKDGYVNDKQGFFSIPGNDLEVSLAMSIDEFKTDSGKCVVNINPIYFEFDKSVITHNAKIELNKVVDVMKNYPELIIEGGSHTDSRGHYNYNLKLSQKRALSTVEYIKNHGVESDRISAKGFGEKQLANKCRKGIECSDQEHEFNRRTEFVIINYDEVKDKYENICAINVVSTKEQIELRNKSIEKAKEKIYGDEFEVKENRVLIKINPIYFDLNSYNIRYDAVEELDKVIAIMNKFPDLIIESGSHTDSRGVEEYNQKLSSSRAKSIINYISAKVINPDRLSGKGYGETMIMNRCVDGVECIDDEHQENRRTEFVIKNPEIIN